VPKHDPKLHDVTEKCETYVVCMTSVEPKSAEDIPNYLSLAKQLNERWEAAKKQLTER